ncbi:MAG: tyrosine-type recombinase/integrase [Gammaproteobacteria bacterium]
MVRSIGHVRREGRCWRVYWRAPPAPGQRPRQRSARLGDVRELPSAAAARRAADRLLERLEPRRLHAGSVVTWPDWCRLYEARYLALLARGSRTTRASIIRRHLVVAPVLAGRAPHEIDAAVVQQFIVDQHVAGAAPSTVRARFALLRRMLRTAADAGLAVTPPRADRLRFPKDETAPQTIRSKAFTPAEVTRILAAAEEPLQTAVALARFAGLRAAEICGLTWDAIDVGTGRLEIRQQALAGEVRPLKSRSSAATLRAPAPLLDRLKSWRTAWPANPAGLLFADASGRPLDQELLRRLLHRLLEQLGIPRRGLHAFRHACALAMAAAAVSPEALRRAMRHASLRTTAAYLSATPEDVAAALAVAATDGETMGPHAAIPQELQTSAQSALTPERTNAMVAP